MQIASVDLPTVFGEDVSWWEDVGEGDRKCERMLFCETHLVPAACCGCLGSRGSRVGSPVAGRLSITTPAHVVVGLSEVGGCSSCDLATSTGSHLPVAANDLSSGAADFDNTTVSGSGQSSLLGGISSNLLYTRYSSEKV